VHPQPQSDREQLLNPDPPPPWKLTVAEAVEAAPGLEHEPLGLLKIPPSPWAAEPDPRPRRRVGRTADVASWFGPPRTR
jgi:hypothetical protein